jgi:hypothetical protein
VAKDQKRNSGLLLFFCQVLMNDITLQFWDWLLSFTQTLLLDIANSDYEQYHVMSNFHLVSINMDYHKLVYLDSRFCTTI